MKRLRVILLFLLLGAVVNVAVAWGITIYWTSIPDKYSQWSSSGSGFEDLHRDWNVSLLTKTGGARLLSTWDIILLSYYAEVPEPFTDSNVMIPGWGEYAYPSGNSYDGGKRTRTIDVRGWPLLSLWSGREQRYRQQLPSDFTFQSHEIIAGYQIPNYYVKPKFGMPEIVILPLRPLWTGFGINTLFYAVLLWLLMPGPFVLRRLIRRNRGLCLKCAYDLRAADHQACPECGEEIRRANPA